MRQKEQPNMELREQRIRNRQRRRRQLKRRRICLQVLGICMAATFFMMAGLQSIRSLAEKADQREDDGEKTDGADLSDHSSRGSDEAGRREANRQETDLEETGSRTVKVQSFSFDRNDPLLILVNKNHSLPEDYEVKLTELPSGLASVASVIYEDLCDMLKDGGKQGLSFVVCSGYRSRERQQELLDEDIRTCMARGMSYEAAYDEVTRETMPVGCSEHNTGLAVDIVALDYQLLDRGQESTPENQWLRENAWRYGFILRYPEGEEAITGIDYESWHFRYVGKEAAEYLHEQGMLLEELWEEGKQYAEDSSM